MSFSKEITSKKITLCNYENIDFSFTYQIIWPGDASGGTAEFFIDLSDLSTTRYYAITDFISRTDDQAREFSLSCLATHWENLNIDGLSLYVDLSSFKTIGADQGTPTNCFMHPKYIGKPIPLTDGRLKIISPNIGVANYYTITVSGLALYAPEPVLTISRSLQLER